VFLNIYKSKSLAGIIQQNLERKSLKSLSQQPDYPQVACCMVLAADLLNLHYFICNFSASVRVAF